MRAVLGEPSSLRGENSFILTAIGLAVQSVFQPSPPGSGNGKVEFWGSWGESTGSTVFPAAKELAVQALP
jgi:hypothetical protein